MRILAEASSILVQVIHVEKSISKCVKYVCSASIYAPRVWMLRRLILRLHSFWVMTCVMELPTKSYRPGPRHRNKSVGRHVTVRRTSTVHWLVSGVAPWRRGLCHHGTHVRTRTSLQKRPVVVSSRTTNQLGRADKSMIVSFALSIFQTFLILFLG